MQQLIERILHESGQDDYRENFQLLQLAASFFTENNHCDNLGLTGEEGGCLVGVDSQTPGFYSRGTLIRQWTISFAFINFRLPSPIITILTMSLSYQSYQKEVK